MKFLTSLTGLQQTQHNYDPVQLSFKLQAILLLCIYQAEVTLVTGLYYWPSAQNL